MLSPEQAAMLHRLAQTEDLEEARRRCEAFLQQTAIQPQQTPAKPEELLSVLLAGDTIPDANTVFGKLTGRVYTSFTVAVVDVGACLPTPVPADCWQVVYGSCLVLVAASGTGAVNMEPLHTLLRKQKLSAGVSRPFDDLSALRQAYRQAAATLRTIRILGRSHTVGFYDDFLMIRLLKVRKTSCLY